MIPRPRRPTPLPYPRSSDLSLATEPERNPPPRGWSSAPPTPPAGPDPVAPLAREVAGARRPRGDAATAAAGKTVARSRRVGVRRSSVLRSCALRRGEAYDAGIRPSRKTRMKLRARNVLKGRVVEVVRGATTAHVKIDLGGGGVITASITVD